jgi:hypothetical protein
MQPTPQHTGSVDSRLLAARVKVKGLDVIPGLRRDLEASARQIEELHTERDAVQVPATTADGNMTTGP